MKKLWRLLRLNVEYESQNILFGLSREVLGWIITLKANDKRINDSSLYVCRKSFFLRFFSDYLPIPHKKTPRMSWNHFLTQPVLFLSSCYHAYHQELPNNNCKRRCPFFHFTPFLLCFTFLIWNGEGAKICSRFPKIKSRFWEGWDPSYGSGGTASLPTHPYPTWNIPQITSAPLKNKLASLLRICFRLQYFLVKCFVTTILYILHLLFKNISTNKRLLF